MSVIMKVSKNDKLVGQCDVQCYDSKPGKCFCVCGGRAHGKRHDEAVRILRQSKIFFQSMYSISNDYKVVYSF